MTPFCQSGAHFGGQSESNLKSVIEDFPTRTPQDRFSRVDSPCFMGLRTVGVFRDRFSSVFHCFLKNPYHAPISPLNKSSIFVKFRQFFTTFRHFYHPFLYRFFIDFHYSAHISLKNYPPKTVNFRQISSIFVTFSTKQYFSPLIGPP